jgi:tetratricopeptide (TPR) repeat protein
MSTHDAFTDLLSEYLDGEDLSSNERARIEAHLAVCEPCRGVLGDLRQIRGRTAALRDVAPGGDLWPGIAERIGAPARGTAQPLPKPRLHRKFTFTMPQLIAAGLALMVVSGAAVWFAILGGSGADFPPLAGQEMRSRTDAIEATPANFADAYYDEAIADLEKVLAEGRSRLDPETVTVLEKNLKAIDEAIDQCRRALESDPANAYLNTHLAQARNRKIALLRRATALANVEG